MHYYQLTTYVLGLPSIITEEQYQGLNFIEQHRYTKQYTGAHPDEGNPLWGKYSARYIMMDMSDPNEKFNKEDAINKD